MGKDNHSGLLLRLSDFRSVLCPTSIFIGTPAVRRGTSFVVKSPKLESEVFEEKWGKKVALDGVSHSR